MGEVRWFDKADYPLHPAALEEWEGFLFAHLEPRSAPPLADALRPLSGASRPWRLPELTAARRIEYDVRDQLEADLPELLGVLPLPARPSGAGEAVPLPQRRQRPAGRRRPRRLHGDQRGNREPDDERPRLRFAPLGDLPPEELRRVYYYSIFPSLFLTVQPDFVMATRICRRSRSTAPASTAEWLFAPEAAAQPGFDPSDGVELWD